MTGFQRYCGILNEEVRERLLVRRLDVLNFVRHLELSGHQNICIGFQVKVEVGARKCFLSMSQICCIAKQISYGLATTFLDRTPKVILIPSDGGVRRIAVHGCHESSLKHDSRQPSLPLRGSSAGPKAPPGIRCTPRAAWCMKRTMCLIKGRWQDLYWSAFEATHRVTTFTLNCVASLIIRQPC